MRTIIYNYRSGQEIIPKDVINGVTQLIDGLDYSLGKYEIKNFKDDLSAQLATLGWSGKVSLSSKSNISITAMLKNIGLCTQTGNMARMYGGRFYLSTLKRVNPLGPGVFHTEEKKRI